MLVENISNMIWPLKSNQLYIFSTNMQEQFLGILPFIHLGNYNKRAQIMINQLELINSREDESKHNVAMFYE